MMIFVSSPPFFFYFRIHYRGDITKYFCVSHALCQILEFYNLFIIFYLWTFVIYFLLFIYGFLQFIHYFLFIVRYLLCFMTQQAKFDSRFNITAK